MSFSKAFAVPTVKNYTTVEHPGGKFDLLPHMHADVFTAVSKNMKLKEIHNFEIIMKSAGDENFKIYEYFETTADIEAMNNKMLACHIVGWSDLVDDDGKLIEFSYTKAVEFLNETPPFRDWISQEVKRLATETESSEEVQEDIKKKSDNT